MSTPATSPQSPSVFADHSRNWQSNYYVYPVISRRSKGLSIGINLNPDKACNFDCIYCQVDRQTPPTLREVKLEILRGELEHMLQLASSGELFEDVRFGKVPAELKRINDIAFSGDGEPTTCPQFAEAVQLAVDSKTKFGLDPVKIILITDACYLTKPAVVRGLEIMDAHQGEIWAKLDAGTEEYYRLINRPNYPLAHVMSNIIAAAIKRPIVIQSLFMKVRNAGPDQNEIDAFCERLNEIKTAAGQIKLVQVYTIARRPTEDYVTPLTPQKVDSICQSVTHKTQLPVEAYYSN